MSTTSTSTTALSPLDLTEILELIFEFTDDVTIRRTVALVCRQWYQLNQNRIPRTVFCDSNMSYSTLAKVSYRLAGATRLYLSISHQVERPRDTLFNPSNHSVRFLLTRAQEEYHRQVEQRKQQQQQRQNPVPYSQGSGKPANASLLVFSPLKELYIDIHTQADIGPLDSYLAPNNTLTRLVLTRCWYSMYYPTMSISLSDILQRCLFLESFEARTAYHTTMEWTPLVVGQQQSFVLKSLILDCSTFRQESLENLLTFTPQLRVLQLIAVPVSHHDVHDWSGARAVLRSRPDTLRTLHISTWEKGMCPEVQQHLLEFCPPLSGWHLRPLDVSVALLKELEVITDRLTVLEFYARPLEPTRPRCDLELKDAPTVLHHFLCTSDRLAHLKTLKTVVYMHDLDIHCRGVSKDMSHENQNVVTKPNSAGVWRCRHLQTLHLDIHGHGYASLSEPVHSRIVFGYVSTLFPLLEELRLYHATRCYGASREYPPRLCLELDGGMCLLGRLKHLQRLEVRKTKRNTWENALYKDIELVDLNWMVSSGHNRKFRKLRKKAVDGWQQQRIQEDELEASRQQQHQQHMSNSGMAKDQLVDEELSSQLKHLGLLREVEEMIVNMDSSTFHPLTCLEGLTFNYYLFNRPEEEIRRSLPPEESLDARVANLFGKKSVVGK